MFKHSGTHKTFSTHKLLFTVSGRFDTHETFDTHRTQKHNKMIQNDALPDETERSPFDAKPLNAEEYQTLLDTQPDLVLRVSDGSPDGTYRFWIEDGQLFWRCLNWGAKQQSILANLRAVLDGDHTTQLLIEQSQNET